MSNEKSCASTSINCEEQANAKLPKNVENKHFLLKRIFRNSDKRGEQYE